MDARMGSFNQTVTQLAASLKPLRRPFLTPAGLCARPSLISVPPTSARSGLLGARLTRNWSWHARSRGARSTNSREVTAANFVEFESDVEEKARKSQVGRRARPQIRSLVKAVFRTWVLLQAKNLHRCRVETVKKSDKKCLLYFLLSFFRICLCFFLFSFVFLCSSYFLSYFLCFSSDKHLHHQNHRLDYCSHQKLFGFYFCFLHFCLLAVRWLRDIVRTSHPLCTDVSSKLAILDTKFVSPSWLWEAFVAKTS